MAFVHVRRQNAMTPELVVELHLPRNSAQSSAAMQYFPHNHRQAAPQLLQVVRLAPRGETSNAR
eukprot:2900601-Amphidinium_carterae.1